jgi:hypothetical protein
VKRRADVVGIFPNESSIVRLIGAVLFEQNDEWQTSSRYMMVEAFAELVAGLHRNPRLSTAVRLAYAGTRSGKRRIAANATHADLRTILIKCSIATISERFTMIWNSFKLRIAEYRLILDFGFSESEGIMRIISSSYWFSSHIRIFKTAFRMRDRFGDRAFLVALRRYHSAISSGGPRRRAFWRELSNEIASQIRRRDMISEALRAAYGNRPASRRPIQARAFVPPVDLAGEETARPVFGKRVRHVSGS